MLEQEQCSHIKHCKNSYTAAMLEQEQCSHIKHCKNSCTAAMLEQEQCSHIKQLHSGYVGARTSSSVTIQYVKQYYTMLESLLSSILAVSIPKHHADDRAELCG